MEITINNKVYTVPATVGELPARRGLAIFTALNDYNNKLFDVNEFNFIYVSNAVGVPKEELEELKFEEFISILSKVNLNFSLMTSPSTAPSTDSNET